MKILNNLSKILFLTFLSFYISCKKEIQKEQKSLSHSIFKDSTTLSKKRVKLNSLKRKVKDNLEESPSYSVAKNYIDSLNTAPFSKVEEIASILKEQMEELKVELPNTLKSKSVRSRIDQVINFCLKTEFTTSKRTIDSVELKNNIDQILKSYNTLVIQLNETQARLPKEIEDQLTQDQQIKKDTTEGTPLF